MFNLDQKSKVNLALIQHCVDKGLIDGNFLRRSLDLEMMDLARRLFEQSDSPTSNDDEPDEKADAEETEEVNEDNGIVLGFGNKNNSRKPIEIDNIGEVKERDLKLTILIEFNINWSCKCRQRKLM